MYTIMVSHRHHRPTQPQTTQPQTTQTVLGGGSDQTAGGLGDAGFCRQYGWDRALGASVRKPRGACAAEPRSTVLSPVAFPQRLLGEGELRSACARAPRESRRKRV